MNEEGVLLKAAISFVFVLSLMGIFLLLLRRYGGLKTRSSARMERRLQVLEASALDPRHKLMVVRCDAQEYLILLGQGTPVMMPYSQEKGGGISDV